jgi:predicted small metal-binding protein
MTFKLACGDVMPGCTARFESTDRDQLMAQIGAHAGEAHGITTFTPEVLQAVESKILVAA